MSASTSGGGGGGGSSGGGPCGACKFLRRKCVVGCIFAPYFDSEQGAAHFAAVHKVFGASNVSKLLLHIPVHKRPDAVLTICYEAQSRLRDPIYGCVAHIFALQQQVVNLQAELSYMQAHLATLQLPSPPGPPPPPPTLAVPPPLSIADLIVPSSSSSSTGSAMPSMSFDLSSLFDPLSQHPWPWPHHQQNNQQQRQLTGDPRQYVSSSTSTSTSRSTSDHSTTAQASVGGVGGDLQALARELLQRHSSASAVEPNNNLSASPPQ